MSDLGISQIVLFGLSMSLLMFNIGVLIYTARNRAVRNELAQSRPFTKHAMAFVRRIVVIVTVLSVALVIVFYYRGLYTIPYLEHEAAFNLRALTLIMYCLVLAIGLTPAAIMLHLTTTLAEIDARKKAAARMRLRMREESMTHSGRRPGNGRS